MSETWEIRRELKDILEAKNIPSGQKLASVVNLFNDMLWCYDHDKEHWNKLINPDTYIIPVKLTKEEWQEMAARQLKTTTEAKQDGLC